MNEEYYAIYPKDRWRDPDYQVMGRFSLKGKKGFVTGGAGGIGRNTAAAWAAAGADVALVGRPESMGRTQALADELSARFGTTVCALGCDVSDPAQVEALRPALLRALGTVDIAHINAGICAEGDGADTSPAIWDRVLATNLTGAHLTAQLAQQIMREHGHGGSIILTSSLSAFRVNSLGGQPAPVAAYSAAKAGLTQLSHYLAAACAPYGIRVNTVVPGYIWSGIHEGCTPKEAHDLMAATIPMGRFGCNDDLHGAMVFLASDASSYITGIDLPVDGGCLVY